MDQFIFVLERTFWVYLKIASFFVNPTLDVYTIFKSLFALQIMKMNQHGHTWVERAPYDPTAFNIGSQKKVDAEKGLSEEKESEEEEEPVKEEANMTVVPPLTEVPSSREDVETVTSEENTAKAKDSGNTEEKPVKRVTICIPETDKEEQKQEVLVRRDNKMGSPNLRRPVRSQRAQTIHFDSPPTSRNKDFRRQSMVMLRQGHTGERGSRKFRAALRKDSVYEVHPGWESIKKLSKVVG